MAFVLADPEEKPRNADQVADDWKANLCVVPSKKTNLLAIWLYESTFGTLLDQVNAVPKEPEPSEKL